MIKVRIKRIRDMSPSQMFEDGIPVGWGTTPSNINLFDGRTVMLTPKQFDELKVYRTTVMLSRFNSIELFREQAILPKPLLRRKHD